jgi:hypothetical protein
VFQLLFEIGGQILFELAAEFGWESVKDSVPLGTGVAMHWIGEFWVQRQKDRPALFSFRAGALFAFGMALVRFIYLELG